MFTWIGVFLLYTLKIETLFLKLKDQKLQTMQLWYKSMQKNYPVGKGLRVIYKVK